MLLAKNLEPGGKYPSSYRVKVSSFWSHAFLFNASVIHVTGDRGNEPLIKGLRKDFLSEFINAVKKTHDTLKFSPQ